MIGTLRDIQPSQPKPTLELSFTIEDGALLTRGKKVPIRMRVDGQAWSGTICNDGTRRAYVHTRLVPGVGSFSTCTEVFTSIGLAHNASLEFRVCGPDELELVRVIEFGAWPTGRAPGDRIGATVKHALLDAANPRVQQEPPTQGALSSLPFDDGQAILRLAEQYWNQISPRDAAEERVFERDFAEARRVGYLSKQLFVRIGRWKSVRQTPNYESNSDAEVRMATAAAFRTSDDEAAIRALMRLRGVALRTATAILHWMRPDRFPILDVRVVAALGEQEPKSYEDIALYLRLAERIRQLAAKHGLDLRTIDRALWTWDKMRSRS